MHFSSAGAVIQVEMFKSCEKGHRLAQVLLFAVPERAVIVCVHRLQQQPLLHTDVGVLGNILQDHVQCDPVTCLSINAFTYYTAVMSFGM